MSSPTIRTAMRIPKMPPNIIATVATCSSKKGSTRAATISRTFSKDFISYLNYCSVG